MTSGFQLWQRKTAFIINYWVQNNKRRIHCKLQVKNIKNMLQNQEETTVYDIV